MEPYQVVPWDHLTDTVPHGTVLEQYVPPELEALAHNVLQLYDLQAYSMKLITSKPDKGGAIWRLDTEDGPRSIKVLHRSVRRSLFSVGAQEYLVKQGARVPALLPTRSGAKYVEAGGKLWIVTDWIEPLNPVSKTDLGGPASLCYGLGEFHRLSRGYTPPEGADISSRIYKWPKHYEKMIEKIGWFRTIALSYPEEPGSAKLLEVVDDFERQAKDMLTRLQESDYYPMVARGEPHWGLAHQDYGWSNGQMGPGGVWIIDLDGVSYDLPIRDLRKLISSTMDDQGAWNIEWIRTVIQAYHQANPLDRETYEVLLIDLAFPNEFYKHIKEIVYDPAAFLRTDLEPILNRVLATETTKWQVLQELALEKENYAPGHYLAVTPEAVLAPKRKSGKSSKRHAAAPQETPIAEPVLIDAPVLETPVTELEPVEAPALETPVDQSAPVTTPALELVVLTPSAESAKMTMPKEVKESPSAAASHSQAVPALATPQPAATAVTALGAALPSQPTQTSIADVSANDPLVRTPVATEAPIDSPAVPAATRRQPRLAKRRRRRTVRRGKIRSVTGRRTTGKLVRRRRRTSIRKAAIRRRQPVRRRAATRRSAASIRASRSAKRKSA